METDSPAQSAARTPGNIVERFPVLRVMGTLSRVMPAVAKLLYRTWYQYVSMQDRAGEIQFMNYGYADLEPEAHRLALRPEDEPDRYSIQLYHHVTAPVDLTGRDVLEVGSGRGGGSAWLARTLNPTTMTGLDMVGKAVQFCSGRHCLPNLRFLQGDAEKLPFAPTSFDAVINIESSHLYGSLSRFLGEVHRVLRPGGHLLLADFRDRPGLDALRRELRENGLGIVKETRITPNVLRALDLNHEYRHRQITHQVPRLLHGAVRQFAGDRGTSYYEAFRTGHWEYYSFVARKPDEPQKEIPRSKSQCPINDR